MTAPWGKGVHRDYTAFVMEVHVRKDTAGNLTSYRCLQGAEDYEAAAHMGGSHGMSEGSWALLTEAARAELLLQLLVKISNDAEFTEKLTARGKIDEGLFRSLSKDTLAQIVKGLDELLPHLAREAVETVKDGLRHQTE
jgi:hypothetical protein